jgi:phosphatidylserine decarboxylase
METVWEGQITPPLGTRVRCWKYQTGSGLSAPDLAKGTEMGRFNMGSTVIVITPPKVLRWAPEIVASTPVRMGQELAQIHLNHRAGP